MRSFLLALMASSCVAGSFLDEPARLAAGDVRNMELRGGGGHIYVLPLRAGQFVSAVAEQRGIDVETVLAAPDGKIVVHSDLPNSDQGPEPVVAIVETTGDYKLTIQALSPRALPGRYELRVEAIRAATEDDQRRVEAERLVEEARILLAKRTAVSMAAALEKDRAALAYFQSAGDRYRQALTLKQIGLLLALTGSLRQALEAYEPALVLFRAVGDGAGEASTANNAGGAYDVLGNPTRVLEHLQLALAAVSG